MDASEHEERETGTGLENSARRRKENYEYQKPSYHPRQIDLMDL